MCVCEALEPAADQGGHNAHRRGVRSEGEEPVDPAVAHGHRQESDEELQGRLGQPQDQGAHSGRGERRAGGPLPQELPQAHVAQGSARRRGASSLARHPAAHQAARQDQAVGSRLRRDAPPARQRHEPARPLQPLRALPAQAAQQASARPARREPARQSLPHHHAERRHRRHQLTTAVITRRRRRRPCQQCQWQEREHNHRSLG